MEKVAYLGLPNCYRITNGEVEVIVTTDVGPRVLRYAFEGGENILGELPDAAQPNALGVWKPLGGHRLWAAPESKPRTYAPDNEPLQFTIESERSIRLQEKTDAAGIEKEMTVTLDEKGTGVTIQHKLTNRNLWGVELAAWALTIMNGEEGCAILPQEPFAPYGDKTLLPARSVAMWSYTDLSDPRWRIGARYIVLCSDAARANPQKLGIANHQGWAAFHRKETLFVKRFAYEKEARYPDFGSNNETYTAGTFLELESLAPLKRLEPNDPAEHIEHWNLFRGVSLGESEDEIEKAIAPLVAQTARAKS